MVYQLKDTLTEEMIEYAGRGCGKLWNLCPIPLCLYNKICLNQRIHAANFGLGRPRVLQTGCLSTLHYIYNLLLIKRVYELQSIIL